MLVEAAVARKSNTELWGEKGYHLVENGEHSWSDLSKRITQVAVEAGYIKDGGEEVLDEEKAKEAAGFESLSWGLNSRGQAKRLRKLLKWTPEQRSIEEEVPTIVKKEWERLHRQ